MAEVITSALDQLTVSPFAVHAPNNFRTTETIKLTMMAMPALELNLVGDTAVLTVNPALGLTVEEATEVLRKASTLLYANAELVSDLDGTTPALVIRQFKWADKENDS